MPPAKRVCGFFVGSTLIFLALMVLWPVLDESYGGLFRAGGNCLVGLGSRGRIWFSSPTDHDVHRDTEVVITDRSENGSVVERTTPVSSRRHGFMPTAFVLALTLATPVSWSRRWRAILWGILLVHTYIALKLALFPVVYGPKDSLGTSWIGRFCEAGLDRLFWIVSASSAGWMLVPLFIWAVVTLRRSDWPDFIRGPAPMPRDP